MIESSPLSSAGSASFRELDDVFLQTQTRIWIGEVLKTRLDEDLHISDLLQDGEILLEVSKVLWNLLLTKCMELRHLKHKYGPFGSRKSSGRYRPYSNVDSFLKLCKILGLSGIDLFSPSDVVEKRDIRKVCICIRALSKKTRSKQLSVPDFDAVIYSITMPTYMVGVIRKSLEFSQCTTISSSSSYSSHKGSNMKLKQNEDDAPLNNRDEDSRSEASDEAESRYMGDGSFLPDRDDSPEPYSVLESRAEYQRTDEPEKTPCNNESDHAGDSSCINEIIEENNYIADYLAFSDLMVHASDGNDSMILDGENKDMFDFFLKVDSQRHASDPMSSKNGKFSDDDDFEVSSTTSMSSVLGRLLTLEFEEQFALDYNDSSVSVEHEDGKHVKDRFMLSDSDKTGSVVSQESESEMGHKFSSEHANRQLSIEILNDGSSDTKTMCHEDGFCFESCNVMDKDAKKEMFYCQDNSDKAVCSVRTGSDSGYVQDNDKYSAAQNTSQDERSEHISDGKKDTIGKVTPVKHGRKELIKTMVKGTAIAGFLLLLMHIRKSIGENEQETAQHGKISKSNRSKPLSTKQKAENRSGKGIYPAERLKF